MTFLRRLFGQSPRQQTNSGVITRTASAAVRRYEKTFSDLATYDREETRKLVTAVDKPLIERAFLRRAKEIENLRKHDRGEITIDAPNIIHVTSTEQLRTELQEAIASLDRGEGQELDMEEVIRTARAAKLRRD